MKKQLGDISLIKSTVILNRPSLITRRSLRDMIEHTSSEPKIMCNNATIKEIDMCLADFLRHPNLKVYYEVKEGQYAVLFQTCYNAD